MSTINVTLDLYSALVCLTLCGSLAAKGQKSKLWLYFLLMCVCNSGIALGDIPAWACTGTAAPWYGAAQWLGALMFWLCSTGMLLFFTAYLIEYISPKVRVARRFWCAALVLGGAHTAGILLSLFNGMFFTITPQNTYQRGPWFWLSQALPLLIYALDALVFAFYRKSLSGRDFSILTSYIALPLAGEVFQALNFGVSLLPAGVAISLLLIYINIQSEQELRLERQEKELAEARIDVMLSQIQPHFLYNSLTAIRHLCDVDPQQAKAAIRDFSMFLCGNMDSLKSKAPIPFEQELAHVQNYLALEQQRFQERLRIVYNISAKDFSVPPLTLQPIVENAVRHGVLRREDGGTVTISTAETPAAWRITVQDDGIGLQPTPQDDGRTHIGIENVRARLAALCGGTLTLESVPGAGTTATITIPKEDPQ